MGTNVIDEELPFRCGPSAPVSVTQTFEAVEAGEITGDEIEFSFRRRQVETRLNAMHHAFHFKKPEGVAIMPPMPVDVYVNMKDDDLKAIFAYLKTVKPIRNAVRAGLTPPAAPAKK